MTYKTRPDPNPCKEDKILIAEMLEELEKVTWKDPHGFVDAQGCFGCGKYEDEGHEPDCSYAALITKAQAATR